MGGGGQGWEPGSSGRVGTASLSWGVMQLNTAHVCVERVTAGRNEAAACRCLLGPVGLSASQASLHHPGAHLREGPEETRAAQEPDSSPDPRSVITGHFT